MGWGSPWAFRLTSAEAVCLPMPLQHANAIGKDVSGVNVEALCDILMLLKIGSCLVGPVTMHVQPSAGPPMSWRDGKFLKLNFCRGTHTLTNHN